MYPMCIRLQNCSFKCKFFYRSVIAIQLSREMKYKLIIMIYFKEGGKYLTLVCSTTSPDKSNTTDK